MTHRADHAYYRDLLAEAAAGELSEGGREELERHVQGCADCRDEYTSLVALQKLLAQRPRLAITDAMVQDARLELRARLRIERTSSGRRGFVAQLGSWFGAPAPSLALVGALAAVVGLALGYLLFGVPAGETPFPAQTAMMIPGSAQGGTQITAVRFIDADASDGELELAFQAVKPMRLKGSPDDPAIQRLLAYALVTEPNAGIRLRTVTTLTERAGPAIDPEIQLALIRVLKYDTNPGVRKQALQALGEFPMDADVKHALLYVLANDPNEGLRIDAINALLPAQPEQTSDDKDILHVLKSRMQNENNNYIRLRTKAALQEVQP